MTRELQDNALHTHYSARCGASESPRGLPEMPGIFGQHNIWADVQTDITICHGESL
jgi:hypothetical protein